MKERPTSLRPPYDWFRAFGDAQPLLQGHPSARPGVRAEGDRGGRGVTQL